jgi:hypothetical protein
MVVSVNAVPRREIAEHTAQESNVSVREGEPIASSFLPEWS